MSILLSDEKIWYAHSGNSMWSDQQKHRAIAKAAAIHAVQYLIALNSTGAGDDPRYQDYLPKAFLRSMLKQLEVTQ
jgi:hypothetical protein